MATINKKTILGETTQQQTIEDETPSSPIGSALMKKKRENQAKRQTSKQDTFTFNIMPC